MVSGRACEIHCLFLLVVAILIAVQLFLQNTQKHLSDDSKSKRSLEPEIHLEKRDIAFSENEELLEEEIPVAAPIVPNIHKSFVKRKAPYARKAKKNRRNKKNKGLGKKGNDHGAKKIGINKEKKSKGIRTDPNKNIGKSSSIHAKK